MDNITIAVILADPTALTLLGLIAGVNLFVILVFAYIAIRGLLEPKPREKEYIVYE